MILIFILTATISTLLIVLNSILGKKSFYEREKPSPFECGFDPKSSSRLPFSLRFYLIALVFLIFDVEITLIMPFPLANFNNLNEPIIILLVIFISILILGLYHEWNQGALNWDN